MLSVHRVVQQQFRNKLESVSGPAFSNAFRNCAKLLLEAFPKQVNGLSLRKKWPQCEEFINHVLSLCRHFEAYNMLTKHDGDFTEFVECLTSAAW